MTTIAQRMWRDGVPGPDGGLVKIRPRYDEYRGDGPLHKCPRCDCRMSIFRSTPRFRCFACGEQITEEHRV